MKTFVQEGRYITVAAPYDVEAGDGCQVGQMFGVAAGDALTGAALELCTQGVFAIDKVGSQGWTVGALIYWDDTNKYCTTTATDNLLIGAAVEAVGSGAGETVGKVRLNGIAQAQEPGA